MSEDVYHNLLFKMRVTGLNFELHNVSTKLKLRMCCVNGNGSPIRQFIGVQLAYQCLDSCVILKL